MVTKGVFGDHLPSSAAKWLGHAAPVGQDTPRLVQGLDLKFRADGVGFELKKEEKAENTHNSRKK